MTVDVQADVLPARREACMLAEQLRQLRVDAAQAQDLVVEHGRRLRAVRGVGKLDGFKADQT
ncbi:hypothetical protein D9M71_835890 [compost metagenome]